MQGHSLSLQVLQRFVAGAPLARLALSLQIPIDRVEHRLRGVVVALLAQAYEYRKPFPKDRLPSAFESQLADIWADLSGPRCFTSGDAPTERGLEAAFNAAQSAGNYDIARFYIGLLMERGMPACNEGRPSSDSGPDEDRGDQVGRLAK